MDQKEQEFLSGRVKDAVGQCFERSVPRFVGFLDAKGAAIAVNAAKQTGAKYSLFGGYEQAERCFFGAFPEWSDCEPALFPITKLRFTNKSDKPLCHRDFLGALMAEGVERDTVGDIIVGHPVTVVFVADSVAEHILLQIDKVGSAGVLVEKDHTDELPKGGGFEELTDTVASARLDCIVSVLMRGSRSQATTVIEDGLVAVNGLEVIKVTKNVCDGDVISVRRVGKFRIDSVSDRSKKNRVIMKYSKYI